MSKIANHQIIKEDNGVVTGLTVWAGQYWWTAWIDEDWNVLKIRGLTSYTLDPNDIPDKEIQRTKDIILECCTYIKKSKMKWLLKENG